MKDNPITYDIIIVGAGLASYTLLESLSKFPDFSKKSVLLINNGEKLNRSWCFWESDLQEPYSGMVQNKWGTLGFGAPGFKAEELLNTLTYYYIPGNNFFNYFENEFLPACKNVTVVFDNAVAVEKSEMGFQVVTSSRVFFGAAVYNSAFLNQKPKIDIWQHFKGWFIETEEPNFNAESATIMDFDIAQDLGCCFVYTLPISPTKALVELTYFSDTLLLEHQYNAGIVSYLKKHIKGEYKVLDTEQGKIPMQQNVFSKVGPNGEINIGTLGGLVKESTGYAFKRIKRDSEILALAYFSGKKPIRVSETDRFHFYDALLLWIIKNEPRHCTKIFKKLFQHNKMEQILKFLDQKTTLLQEIRIFATLPTIIFLKALVNHVFRRRIGAVKTKPYVQNQSVAVPQKV